MSRGYQIAGTHFIATISVLPVAIVDDLYVAIASITFAVGAALAANAAYYAVLTDLAPRMAGTAMGTMTVWFAASGFLAPVIAGYAYEFTGSFRPAFLLMSVIAATSVIGVLLFHHPDREKDLVSTQD